jgi:DNA-binding NarL/FixJ family response regulator
MITVLIADDHMMVRDVLRRLLEMANDIQIVAMVSNGQEAVEQAVLHCPNVAVTDFSMPTMDGVEATKQICARCPQTRVLMFSMYSAPWYIQRSVQAGALGYVLKDGVDIDLVIAIRSLYQGNRYYSKQIAEIAKRYIQ